MRNILVAAAIAVTSIGAAANPHGHHHHRDWVGPAITGAIIGGMIANQSRQDAPQVYQPRVVVPQYVYPSMPRATPMPYRRAIDIYIPECACYRTIQIIVWE